MINVEAEMFWKFEWQKNNGVYFVYALYINIISMMNVYYAQLLYSRKLYIMPFLWAIE